jgi:hypothetical protein
MTSPQYDKVVGFSGHQELSAETREKVRTALMSMLSKWEMVLAVTSLAAGSDQIFAECALATGGQLMVVIPCEGYERTFGDPIDLAAYRRLLAASIDTVRLPFQEPSEEAYWAAGKRVVDVADTLIAVWDGQPAGGLGGTADVVEYAQTQNKKVLRVWPLGASRK